MQIKTFVREPDEAIETARDSSSKFSKQMLGLLESATGTYLLALSRALRYAGWEDGRVEIQIRQGSDLVYFQKVNIPNHE